MYFDLLAYQLSLPLLLPAPARGPPLESESGRTLGPSKNHRLKNGRRNDERATDRKS
jgi:hypothetical protein